MADPKFENLPGIAYDEPDFYETPDVAQLESSDYYEEEPENEYIERVHISTKHSFEKFRGKQLLGDVDFSDRISIRMRKGYLTWSDDYEIIAGQKETPVEKCRRLQFEMNELLDDVTGLQLEKEVEQEDRKSYEAVANVISKAKKVLDSLRLEQVLGKEQTAILTDKEVNILISEVEAYKKSGVLTANKLPCNDLAASTRVAKLEHRMHEIEKAVGSNPEKLRRLSGNTGASNLLEAVRQLNTKAALLQPSQLDKIEARLHSLCAKIDNISEKATDKADGSIRDQKIFELYDIAKKTETVAEILPDIVERMQALESLHKYAMNFAKIVAEIEEKQNSIAQSLISNRNLLHSVQETFAKNVETIQINLGKLETRISNLSI